MSACLSSGKSSFAETSKSTSGLGEEAFKILPAASSVPAFVFTWMRSILRSSLSTPIFASSADAGRTKPAGSFT